MYILNLQTFLCIIEKIMWHGHFCPDWGGQHAFEGAYMKKKIIYANLCIFLISRLFYAELKKLCGTDIFVQIGADNMLLRVPI